MSVIPNDSGEMFNLCAVGFLSLVYQPHIAEMLQDNLHCTGICKDNELFFDLAVFPIWLFICVTEHQNDFIPVILKLVLECQIRDLPDIILLQACILYFCLHRS